MLTLYYNDYDCCGCETCASVCSQSAISMNEDAFGFRYPKINTDKCIQCGICLKKCDFQKHKNDGVGLSYPIESYAVYHTELNTLKNSTSGGVFTAFAEYVINHGGCVYGCTMDENFNVKIVRGDTLGDIEPMRGSKYLQSEIGDVYKDVKIQLQSGRLVLFTGTPCQVAALKSYLGNVPTDKLITIDLICHGVPSQKSFKMYIKLLESLIYKNEKILSYRFRSKEFGWGIKSAAIELFSKKNGKIKKRVVPNKNDFYKSNYVSWNSIRICCASCKYANNNRVGDFTMGDFWGWEKLGVEIPTSNGLSVLFVNTNKWAHLLKDLNLKMISSPVEVALQGNGALNKPTVRGRYWNDFMQCVANNDYLPFYQGFEKYRKTRNRKENVNKIKNVIKTPYRLIKKLFNQ